MTLEKNYGFPPGLPDRLEEAANRMARDKGTPWLGMGLYADLLCAADMLRGKTVTKPKPMQPITEYDL